MKTADLHWLAGLLEGEGCFYISPKGQARICLNMTDVDVVARAAGLLKADLKPHGRQIRPHHKKLWCCMVYSKRAIGWMMTLLPMMGSRRSAKIREIILTWKAHSSKPGRVAGKDYRSKLSVQA